VVSTVQRRYPSVSASKIRYLESRGLVTPARTTGGTRRYSAADVELIERILRMQADEFLPLDVIAERLSTTLPMVDSEAAASGNMVRPPVTVMDTEQFLGRTSLTRELLEACQEQGLIERLDTPNVVIGGLVAKLGEHGLEPRHLRSIRLSADRVVDLVDKSTLGPAKGGQVEANSGDGTDPRRQVLELLIHLHTALLMNAART